ncbi:TraB/VirB10 family protein [Campylobacter upsaliensis]|uniref:Conjugal transfer protein TraB n=2 Tax=Campylobacter TaxID=194 RepID=A0ABS5P2T2_9BACT|nr:MULTISPECIES: TraB/VirB10 family protein [Campylobacter]ECP7432627.1 conjugal transfer protein TraB [Campylobacter jejuni]EAB5281491.1 conjugal transfer protein TraB [Campylobacter upsaliensis]EAH7597477.1 conjugal transfer protein TraB [Campylobacter upsaliensis]EAI0686962.1 conjugal transfer protein TraB [Campylobacter upsaliensis]EAI2893781.1 conjugal transfer protein TraB [Campylobacter upsaliensis]
MKNPFMKFFSNDKDINNLEKRQKSNKILISSSIIVILFIFMLLLDNDKKVLQENAGDFKIVNSDEMAKTKWVGEASSDLGLTKKSVDEVLNKNNKLEKEIDELRKIVSEAVKNQNKINENNTINETPLNNTNLENRNTNQNNIERLYQDFPKLSIEENNETFDILNSKLPTGKVPELEQIEQTRYTPLTDSLNFTNIAKPEVKEEKEKKTKRHIIPTGSIVKAVLLSGMDAPTMTQAKTEPLPVLMKVTELSILPNSYAYDIQDCFLMGEGYGDLTSERAYIRVNNISCVTNKGQKIDMVMKGAATGEDGKLGLRGEVVTKQGALLARTLIAGFLQGVGESFANKNQIVTQNGFGGTTTTNGTMNAGESLQAGAFEGLSKSAEKLADFYLKMADQVTPVIEISAGREVNIITTATLELKTLEEQDKDEKKSQNNQAKG